ncbi:receptor-like protein kinase HERK 1 [Bidens hawaiensis]|uniref:receptor-like protein kinase HERK 1 n=1 Tax=Bidens hawaiensis TaxID=980011 RepID=UPI004049F06F
MIDSETIEEAIYDFDSNKESNIIQENKEDDKSIEVTSTSESNGDTSTITNQEADESNILKSDIEDGLEHLRIPFEKIKFGQKIDVCGYGTLFEGEFNNQQVALKRLNITNLGNIKPKLLSAILTISRFRKHPNLVALIGFCDESDKEIILVYEYVSGGNLADNMSKHLTTIQRLQICLGAARGVEYLHGGDEFVDSKPVIIHGDLKLSKILLNPDSNSSNFDAKVSGFGLPKVFPGHIEISPKSMDPVHAATGKLTKESDVYTFGVVLLEVLCGVPELVDTDDYQERHVTELVPKRSEQNMLRKMVHFDIRNEITTESLETYAKIACRCVMKSPEERPAMSEVVIELEKALRLQGGEVNGVQVNGNGLAEVPVGEDDHEDDDNGETISSDITEEESKVVEETVDDTNLQRVRN